MVCIVCPLGCLMNLEVNEEIKVTGNTCKRGAQYAVKECTNPTRTITTTVGVNNGDLPVVPVKTSSEVPKNMLMECMEVIRGIKVNAPVKSGDILVKNMLGIGVDIVATRDVKTEKCIECCNRCAV